MTTPRSETIARLSAALPPLAQARVDLVLSDAPHVELLRHVDNAIRAITGSIVTLTERGDEGFRRTPNPIRTSPVYEAEKRHFQSYNEGWRDGYGAGFRTGRG